MRRKAFVALGMAAVLLMGAACTPEQIVTIPSASNIPGESPLTVSTPEVPAGVDPQEGVLLAHVYAAALNAAGLKAVVNDTPTPAGTVVAGVAAGTIDIAPVFSRLALAGTSPSAPSGDAAEVLVALKAALPSGVELLDPAKAQDMDNVVVTAVTAERYKLTSLADLAGVCSKLTMGGPAEFKGQVHGLLGLGSDYNCVPKEYRALQPTPGNSDDSTLWELLRDDIQLANIHSSSPAIDDNSLVVLSDPKGLFTAQDLVPMVSKAAVPEAVQAVLNKVSAALTEEELANLNRLAQDRHFGDLSEAATAWLVQKGLVKASS